MSHNLTLHRFQLLAVIWPIIGGMMLAMQRIGSSVSIPFPDLGTGQRVGFPLCIALRLDQTLRSAASSLAGDGAKRFSPFRRPHSGSNSRRKAISGGPLNGLFGS